MVSQLIKHERIETTLPKAKELRRVADQMVTLGKEVRRRRWRPSTTRRAPSTRLLLLRLQPQCP